MSLPFPEPGRSTSDDSVALACFAMATRFEVLLYGADKTALRAAGEEAISEIERIEEQLSLYQPSSEIARLNAHAADAPVRVSPSLFALLDLARRLHEETGGVFDITIAPLVRCWGFMGGGGRMARAEELEEARSLVGMNLVQLNAKGQTVRFARQGVMLDLGAIGKGYAIQQAAELLREAGVTSALLHGGTSSIYALGSPPGADAWTVAIGDPRGPARNSRAATGGDLERPQPATLCQVSLKNESLAVSAIGAKSFEHDGRLFGHVLDPRSGQPVHAALLAAVVLPSATESDALSTALITVGFEGHDRISRLRDGMRSLVVKELEGSLRASEKGIVLA